MEGPPKKKRRGGHQQRLAQQKAEPESDGRCETSALCLLLLNLFAWGYFSPQRVQQIAEMAVKDIEKSKEDPNFGRPVHFGKTWNQRKACQQYPC